jgi:hypothetical protein
MSTKTNNRYIASGDIVAHVSFSGEPGPELIDAVKEMIRLAHKHSFAPGQTPRFLTTEGAENEHLTHSKTGKKKTSHM